MTKKTIVFYTAEGCTPCEEVSKLIQEGKFASPDADEIDLVDIGTDEGFGRFAKDVLSKNDGGVPSAYLDGKKCQIEKLDDNTLYIECPKDGPPAGPGEIASPPESGA